jgi:hypothetical protein
MVNRRGGASQSKIEIQIARSPSWMRFSAGRIFVYTKRPVLLDALDWVRGGTWTHQLGSKARIGLVSMDGSGFQANFDYVHVSTLSD